MGILDMIPTEFNATDDSVHSYYTFNHVVGENKGKYEQSDGYNCGIFTIMMLLRAVPYVVWMRTLHGRTNLFF